mgnify:CR=1 FL=1
MRQCTAMASIPKISSNIPITFKLFKSKHVAALSTTGEHVDNFGNFILGDLVEMRIQILVSKIAVGLKIRKQKI